MCVVDRTTYGMSQPDGQTPQRPSGIPASTMFSQPRRRAVLRVSHTACCGVIKNDVSTCSMRWAMICCQSGQ